MCAAHKEPPPLDRRCALFIDVDGTLLEIAPRPNLVQVPRQIPALLDRLAQQRGGALALVSGRPLAELDRLFRPWRGAAAGLHGAERRRADGSQAPSGDDPADHAAAAALAALRPGLHALAQASPGLWLEDKGLTLALRVERLRREAGDTLRLIAGKMVVELQPSHHGKGRVIAAFLAEPPFCGRCPVFLGDDTTDEDGFAEINRRGGVAILIGPQLAATAAPYALPSVAKALKWLAGTAAARGRCQP
jgi:trehalose 6-phosphate phosphatase